MINSIVLNGKVYSYELTYKKVKNINLRVKEDGSISVSANRRVPVSYIEEFLLKKSDFILSAISHMEQRRKLAETQTRYFTLEELKETVLEMCKEIFPYYESRGVARPEIKFRKMKAAWGNCHFKSGVITFNTALVFAPYECVKYVVAHEFTHLLVPNHSKDFYRELALVMPDWKPRRVALKNISTK